MSCVWVFGCRVSGLELGVWTPRDFGLRNWDLARNPSVQVGRVECRVWVEGSELCWFVFRPKPFSAAFRVLLAGW